jgi:outer membrane protein assembly factor BamA
MLLALAARTLPAEPPLESAVSKPAVIRSVTVSGTRRPVALATQVGQPYNAAVISRDVRTLWNMGRFEDVRAEIRGAAVIFHVVESRQVLGRKMLTGTGNGVADVGARATEPVSSRE